MAHAQSIIPTDTFIAINNLVEVMYAYHVTDVKVEYGEDGVPVNQPDWEKLLWSRADDKEYDGPLFNAPCVFFSTTLYKGDLPTISVYPRHGINDCYYWYVKVPLKSFNKHRILHINKPPSNNNYNQKDRVKLLLVTASEYESMVDKGYDCEKAESEAKKYLCRKEESGELKYYSNDFDSRNRCWVSFAVLHYVKLKAERGVEWNNVKHFVDPRFAEYAPAKRETLRRKLFEQFSIDLAGLSNDATS